MQLSERQLDYRPAPRTLAGDTPNPGAMEMSIASVLLPALAAFSMARGLGALVAPPRDHVGSPAMARLIGAGEAIVGVGLAAAPVKGPWVWARMGLDALEGLDRARGGAGPVSIGRRVTSLLVDAYAATRLAPAAEARTAQLRKPARVSRSVTIGRGAEELHALWRDPATQALIWEPLAEADATDPKRLRLRFRNPMGQALEVRAVPLEEKEGKLLRWRASSTSGHGFTGELRFNPAPGDRGTEVTLALDMGRPVAATPLAALPKAGVTGLLSRFKALAETGEVPRLKPQPSARRR